MDAKFWLFKPKFCGELEPALRLTQSHKAPLSRSFSLEPEVSTKLFSNCRYV